MLESFKLIIINQRLCFEHVLVGLATGQDTGIIKYAYHVSRWLWFIYAFYFLAKFDYSCSCVA